MGKFKLEFDLIQQTPMIHFQHNETGVAIRPSEVKPKLDKFIHLWMENKKKTVPDSWYIDKDKKIALNYKMRIIAPEGGKLSSEEVRSGLFQGNLGRGREIEKSKYHKIKYEEPLKIKIITFAKDKLDLSDVEFEHEDPGKDKRLTLLSFLEFIMDSFFMLNNFGMRTSKGFGSFKITKNTSSFKMRITDIYPTYFYIDYEGIKSIQKNNCWEDDVWAISGLMKSGFNFTGLEETDYYKGAVLRCLHDKGIGNDKDFINQKILIVNEDDNQNNESRMPKNGYRFVRAMLGLPNAYRYLRGVRTGKTAVVRNYEIKRFQSPVIFKINDNRLFIFPKPIPLKMYDAKFIFRNKESGINDVIYTPKSDEFKLIDFLKKFSCDFNYKTGFKKFKNPVIKSIVDNNLQIVTVGENHGK